MFAETAENFFGVRTNIHVAVADSALIGAKGDSKFKVRGDFLVGMNQGFIHVKHDCFFTCISGHIPAVSGVSFKGDFCFMA